MGRFNKPNITRARLEIKTCASLSTKTKKSCQITNIFSNHFYKNHKFSYTFCYFDFFVKIKRVVFISHLDVGSRDFWEEQKPLVVE